MPEQLNPARLPDGVLLSSAESSSADLRDFSSLAMSVYRVSDRAVMPGTAFFEMAFAAASSLWADDSSGANLALAAATIAAPRVLGPATPAGDDSPLASSPEILECAACFGGAASSGAGSGGGGAAAAGALEIRSGTAGGPVTAGGTSSAAPGGTLHLSCTVVTLVAPAAAGNATAIPAAAALAVLSKLATGSSHGSRHPSTVAAVASPLSCAGEPRRLMPSWR